MTYPDKLRWLADNDGAEIEFYHGVMCSWCAPTINFTVTDIKQFELRLSRAEVEKRNPGYEILAWVGRKSDDEVDCRTLINPDKYYYDGWLLRKVEEKKEENKSCANCRRRSKVSPDACNSLDNCYKFSLWMPNYVAEKKPVVVKAWVRWAKVSTYHPVTKIQPASSIFPVAIYEIRNEWRTMADLIKEGCEHTDTPNEPESWRKIGG
jgi:hypothetical protein